MRSILRLSALPMLCALLAQIAMVPAVAATTFTAGYQYEMAVPGVNRADVWSGAVRPDSPLFYVESIVTPGGLPATGVTQLGGGGLATYGHVNSTSFGFTGMRTEFPNQSTYLHADTTNAMSDSFVIDCAGCTAGAIGSLSFRVYWGGGGLREVVTTVPGTALSGYVADINWSSSFQIRADGVPDPFPPDQPGPPNPGRLGLDYYFLETERNGERRIEESPRVSAGLQELSIRFVFGQPIHIDMSLRAAVLGAVYSGEDQTSSFDAIVNQISAYGQMYWDGITGVSTADGQRIDAFTAVNQVGVDYARSLELPILQIVPEPGTWALMLGGLALMGVVARRRVHALRTAMVETVSAAAASARAVAPALLAAALLPALAAPPALAATAPAPAWAGYGETLTAYDPSLHERDHFAGDDRIGGTSSLTFHTGYSTALTRTRLDAEGVTQVNYGQLRTRAAVSGSLDTINDGGRQTIANMFAGGSIHDEFVIACAGCADGTTGMFTARVHVDGTISTAGALTGPSPTATMTQGASWNFNAALTAQGVDAAVGVDRVSGTRSVSLSTGLPPFSEDVGDPLGWHTLTVSFVFGQPIALDLGLGVQAYHFLSTDDGSGATGWAAVGTDFSHSLTWEGISALTGADGQAITGFTALNTAGVDYARSLAAVAPVPEPGTWALMAGGLGLLVLGRSRRARRTAA